MKYSHKHLESNKSLTYFYTNYDTLFDSFIMISSFYRPFIVTFDQSNHSKIISCKMIGNKVEMSKKNSNVILEKNNELR